MIFKEIKIGTSGFWDKSWVGPVYPSELKPANALYYYEKQLGFNVVEINSTFYSLIPAKLLKTMSNKTSQEFEFVAKVYKGITHDLIKQQFSNTSINLQQAKDFANKFYYSISPLLDEKKLSVVLLQFPTYFTPSQESKEYILYCKEWLKDLELVIEFRNKMWNNDETFSFFRKNSLTYCIVDAPKHQILMPFSNITTTNLAYIRLHGRNPKWFNSSKEERYKYFYSDQELKNFIPEIKKVSKNVKKTYIFFNNCHGGFAVKNALKLKELIGYNITKNCLF